MENEKFEVEKVRNELIKYNVDPKHAYHIYLMRLYGEDNDFDTDTKFGRRTTRYIFKIFNFLFPKEKHFQEVLKLAHNTGLRRDMFYLEKEISAKENIEDLTKLEGLDHLPDIRKNYL